MERKIQGKLQYTQFSFVSKALTLISNSSRLNSIFGKSCTCSHESGKFWHQSRFLKLHIYLEGGGVGLNLLRFLTFFGFFLRIAGSLSY